MNVLMPCFLFCHWTTLSSKVQEDLLSWFNSTEMNFQTQTWACSSNFTSSKPQTKKVMARAAEPVHLPHTGDHLTYSLGSTICFSFAPLSPACTNLLWTLKWPLCFKEVVSAWQVGFSWDFYSSDPGLSCLCLCHHLSLGKQYAYGLFLNSNSLSLSETC